jgi:hypothetical protein
MGLLPNPLPPLHPRPLRAIKHKQRQERRVHEPTAPKEEGAQFRVLAFFAVGGVEEPDGCVDADAETTEGRGGDGGRGDIEAVLEGDMGEGTGLGGRAENVPEAGHAHR